MALEAGPLCQACVGDDAVVVGGEACGIDGQISCHGHQGVGVEEAVGGKCLHVCTLHVGVEIAVGVGILPLEIKVLAAPKQVLAVGKQHIAHTPRRERAHTSFLVGRAAEAVGLALAHVYVEDVRVEARRVGLLVEVHLLVFFGMEIAAALGSEAQTLHAVGVLGAVAGGFGQEGLGCLLQVLVLLQRFARLTQHTGRKGGQRERHQHD